MKISFPKYGIGELLAQNRLATGIISFIAIVVFAGVFGSYFLGGKLWMLMIAMLGIGGIVVYVWAAPAIFLTQNKVDEAPSTPIEENVPQITSQWDYRPRKPIRARTVLDGQSTETSDRLSSDPFGRNDNVWLNENSLEDVASHFINDSPEVEEPITEALPPTTDSACSTPPVDDVGISRYD